MTYETTVDLVSALSSLLAQATAHTNSWRQYCADRADVVPFLLQLCLALEGETSAVVLQSLSLLYAPADALPAQKPTEAVPATGRCARCYGSRAYPSAIVPAPATPAPSTAVAAPTSAAAAGPLLAPLRRLPSCLRLVT